MALRSGDTRKVKIAGYNRYGHGLAPYGEDTIVVENIQQENHPIGCVIEIVIKETPYLDHFDYNAETTLWSHKEDNIDLSPDAPMPRSQRLVNKHYTRNKRRSATSTQEQLALWEREQEFYTPDELDRYIQNVRKKAEAQLLSTDYEPEDVDEKDLSELQEMLKSIDIDMNIEHEIQKRLQISDEEWEEKNMNNLLRELGKF